MSTHVPLKIAILDDYQRVALQSADWSLLQKKAEITVFNDHLSDSTSLIERLKPFDVLCVMRERTPLSRLILEKLPNLKLIASTGRRNSSIDVTAAKSLGILVCNTGYKSNGALELTWGLILSIVRNLPAEIDSVRKQHWQVSVGGDLEGKTLGILGLGKIGSSCAKIARAFGMNVIAWSQNLTTEKAKEVGAQLVSKEELFSDSDIVTLHLVLSGRTKHIVGTKELSLMKKTAYLINSSRGGLIDEKALIHVLQKHEIAGAALDVYEIEPLPKSHPLRTFDNVLATPHIGFVTKDTYQIFYQDTVENILSWMDGKPLRLMD